MKKMFFLFFVIVVVSLFFSSCKKEVARVNVVTAFTNHDWPDEVDQYIAQIEASTTVEEARALIITSGLQRRIEEINKGHVLSFIFLSPSGDTLTAVDTLGNKVSGFIDHKRLLVKMEDGKVFFVVCMNGLLTPIHNPEIIGEVLYVLGYAEGPMHHGATWDELWNMVKRFNTGKTCKDQKLYFHAYDRYGNRRIVDLSTLKRVKKSSKKYRIKLSVGGCNPSTRHQLSLGSRFRRNIDGTWEYLP